MAAYRRVDDLVTCRLTAFTLASAPGPTLSNKYYGKPLPFLYLLLHVKQGLQKHISVICQTHFHISFLSPNKQHRIINKTNKELQHSSNLPATEVSRTCFTQIILKHIY